MHLKLNKISTDYIIIKIFINRKIDIYLMTVFRIENRVVSFLIVLAVYILALFVAAIVFKLTSSMHFLLSTFLADIAATIVVWLAGVLFDNSSVYDPYWSVAPIVILPFWVIVRGNLFSAVDILFLAAVTVWGIRLTLNWAIRWKGMHHQDWRYTMLKKKSPRLWFFTNLLGINLMPTVIVFAALTPAYFGVGQEKKFNFFTGIYFAICMCAVLVQAISDRQMELFKKDRSNKDKYIDRGLWRYSRHPNYFGEILFWWGIWLMQMSVASRIWVTVTGPVLVTLLFIFVSIPMMEKHLLASIPAYSNYRRRVSMLKPMPRKK